MDLYTELVEKSIANRGNIVGLQEIKVKKTNYERYISLFLFDEGIKSHFKRTNSMSNYTDKVGINTIWIDFDNEGNLEDVKKEVLRFVNQLNNKYDFPEDYIPVYFSGSKGFHVGIPAKVIGLDGVFEKDLPAKVKSFIAKLTNNIMYVDLVIYNHTRIMRLPFSFNEKGKMYKIHIPYKILKNESLKTITQYAKKCKIFKPVRFEYAVCSELYLMFLNSNVVEEPKKTLIKATNGTINKGSVFRVPEKGKRNDTLFKQAFRLFSLGGIKIHEVHDIMNAFLRLTEIESGENFSPREFATLINSAYKRAFSNGRDIKMNTIESLTYNVFDIISKSACVPTGIKTIDEDLGGGLKLGNLYPFIGKAGTKKSIVAQMIALKAAIEGSTVIYFNMEMSAVELFRRTALRLLDMDIYDGIRKGTIAEPDLDGIQNKLKDFLSNNFYQVDNSDLTTPEFSSIIEDVEEKNNEKVKLVVVDSMNSMKTIGGSEVMTAFENTKKLKEIAKLHNVAVIMVTHVNAACPLHYRDTSLYARGGQKIMDNCDAWFSISKCIDRDNSRLDGENSDYIYLNDVIFMRFHNKRETGSTIDSILTMEDNLAINLSTANPKGYEV